MLREEGDDPMEEWMRAVSTEVGREVGLLNKQLQGPSRLSTARKSDFWHVHAQLLTPQPTFFFGVS